MRGSIASNARLFDTPELPGPPKMIRNVPRRSPVAGSTEKVKSMFVATPSDPVALRDLSS